MALNFLAAALFVKPKTNPAPTPKFYTVTQVVDGDTFVIRDGDLPPVYVRLINVNAPEQGRCGYLEAKTALENLILNRQITLESSVNDKYNRPLIVARLGDIIVNEYIVSTGWARFTSARSTVSKSVQSAFQKSKSAHLGVFSPQCFQSTNLTQPDCVIKGNVKDGHKIYFYPGCGNYSNVALELDQGDQWFCSEEEARASGFTRSQNCH